MCFSSYIQAIAPYFFMSLFMFGFCEASACDSTNPSCEQAIELFEFNLTGDTECIQGCADGEVAGRFDRTTDCSGSPFATSWYRISSGVEGRVFNLEINSADLGQIVVTMYQGNCTSSSPLECNNGKSRSVNLRNIFVEAGTEYYIAVSSLQGATGNFDLCYSFALDENQCNKQPFISVVSTSLGSPLSGPFKPNEDVEICYTISGFENNGCNYLQGIVPFFGTGWSATSFNSDGSPKNISVPLETQGHTSFTTADPICEGDPAGTWSWYASGVLSYNLNSTNPMAYRFGDDIEAGWVFLNSFDPSCFEFDDACCVNPTDDPNQSFGDDNYPVCGGGLTHEWQVCMILTTAVPSDCVNNTDCMIGFKSFADGELGAFRSNDCSKDRVSYFNAAVECCTAPAITTQETQIALCAQETRAINLDVSDPSASIYWIGEQGEINRLDPNATEMFLTAPDTGQKIYEIYATNGCTSEPLRVEVTSSAPSQVELRGSAAICEGEDALLQLELEGVSPWTVILNDGEGGSETLIIDETTYAQTYTPTQNMIISIESAIDGNGCTIEQSGAFEVTVGVKPEVQTDDTMTKYCNQAVELSAEPMTTGGDYQYVWLDASGDSIGQGETIEVTESGIYTLMVTDNNNGCLSSSLVSVVDNPEDLQIEVLNGTMISLSEGSIIMLELVTNLDMTEINSLLWTGPEGLDCYDCLTPIVSTTVDASYTIIVEDIYGCIAQKTVNIIITNKVEKANSLYIPTAFQPNTPEEANFCVFAESESEAIVNMEVFDRWGSVVFNVQDAPISEACWDGTFGGQLLEQGVYVYKLVVSYPGESEFTKSGTFTLLR